MEQVFRARESSGQRNSTLNASNRDSNPPVNRRYDRPREFTPLDVQVSPFANESNLFQDSDSDGIVNMKTSKMTSVEPTAQRQNEEINTSLYREEHTPSAF